MPHDWEDSQEHHSGFQEKFKHTEALHMMTTFTLKKSLPGCSDVTPSVDSPSLVTPDNVFSRGRLLTLSLRHGDTAIGDALSQPLKQFRKAAKAIVSLAERIHLLASGHIHLSLKLLTIPLLPKLRSVKMLTL